MDKPAERRVVGGPCEYKAYGGHATIISIHKKEVPGKAGGPSKVVYEVRFSFTPHEEIKEGSGQVEGKEYLLLLGVGRNRGDGDRHGCSRAHLRPPFGSIYKFL